MVPSPINPLIETWRSIVVGESISWVLFRHGTCVIFAEPVGDLRTRAIDLLREWGPVHAGGPAGDYKVITLRKHLGWVVAGHHRDILTYVGPDELSPQALEETSDVLIGLLGRGKRDQDASELDVIHVEDGRNAA